MRGRVVQLACDSARLTQTFSIVMMDELDQLLTTKQDVIYNFFNWPTIAQSKLIVLAVANTMDLPTRVMSGKVRSRMGMLYSSESRTGLMSSRDGTGRFQTL